MQKAMSATGPSPLSQHVEKYRADMALNLLHVPDTTQRHADNTC